MSGYRFLRIRKGKEMEKGKDFSSDIWYICLDDFQNKIETCEGFALKVETSITDHSHESLITHQQRPRANFNILFWSGTLLYLIDLPSFSQHLTYPWEMFNSNVIIDGGIFNSGHGGLTINNTSTRDPEFGMHDFMSVMKRIPIDDPMKDFIPWD